MNEHNVTKALLIQKNKNLTFYSMNKMKHIIPVFLLIFISNLQGQDFTRSYVQDMRWGEDYNIYLTLTNDSGFILKVDELYHPETLETGESEETYTYYPVSLSGEFINELQARLTSQNQEKKGSQKFVTYSTLWSSFHENLGGGWAHFVNCLLYSLETRNLHLNAPLMKRPQTNWRPEPVTESYLHTRKWEYYAPFDQGTAQREYRRRASANDLEDLRGVPQSFVTLFLSTSQKEYESLRAANAFSLTAKIDLVKLLLGARYLGQAQISYITTQALKSALDYSVYNLPSVILFDAFNAAVAMSLDETGYQVEYILFTDEERLSDNEQSLRKQRILAIVENLNTQNRKTFEDKLKNRYNEKANPL